MDGIRPLSINGYMVRATGLSEECTDRPGERKNKQIAADEKVCRPPIEIYWLEVVSIDLLSDADNDILQTDCASRALQHRLQVEAAVSHRPELPSVGQ